MMLGSVGDLLNNDSKYTWLYDTPTHLVTKQNQVSTWVPQEVENW